MSFSPFSHPYLSGLLGDEEIAQYFTAEAELGGMIAFERALANAQAAAGIIPVAAAAKIGEACETLVPEVEALRVGTGRDGVVVPEFVKQLRAAVGPEFCEYVHFGATSQDVVDTSLILRLLQVFNLFIERLQKLDEALDALDHRFGPRMLMGHTRMQAAIPITTRDRLQTWREPLLRHRNQLEQLVDDGLPLQFGGAAGTLDRLGDKGIVIRIAIATELGLKAEHQWQSQRDRIAEIGSLLSLLTGSLGKFGQDVALLAQAGREIELSGGGGSSAMAHKQNPVAAEVLVSLARFNAVQLGGLHQSIVHEQERSGAAWTLEWLILPQMVAATGASLRLARELAGNIRSLGIEQL